MTDHDDLLERLERVNPVPDPSGLDLEPETSRLLGRHVRQRREATGGIIANAARSRARAPWGRKIVVGVAAVLIVGVGIGVLLQTTLGNDGGVPTPTTPAQPVAIGVTDLGIPAVWSFTVTAEEIDVVGGVRIEKEFRLDSAEASAQGVASHVVEASEMVQGAVVTCAGRTYGEAHLWSSTSRGEGVLDLGEAGSVTIEYEAVVVTSSHMKGLGSGHDGAASTCGEWRGVYQGASGELLGVSGTFGGIWSTPGHSEQATWTFES